MESSPIQVLVVDDEPSVRKMLRRWIELALHAEVSEAGDGLQALEAISSGKMELVISDINMPVLNGIDMLNLLHTDPNRNRLEVMIASQVANEEKVRQAIELGATDYLLKPLNHDWVTSRLNRAAERIEERRKELQAAVASQRSSVLVADPDPGFCAVAQAALRSEFAVETARSITETLVKVKRRQPEIVLLSTALPGLRLDFAAARIDRIAAEAPQIIVLSDREEEVTERIAGRMPRSYVPEALRMQLLDCLRGATPTSGIASWSKFLDRELTAALLQSFGMMAGSEPEIAETGTDPEVCDLHAWIEIIPQNRRFRMRLELTGSEALARAFNAAMLGDDEEDPDPDSQYDALKEALNVIAGRVKNSCLARRIEVAIGLPRVAPQRPKAFGPSQFELDKFCVWQQDLAFRVTLRVKETGKEVPGAIN